MGNCGNLLLRFDIVSSGVRTSMDSTSFPVSDDRLRAVNHLAVPNQRTAELTVPAVQQVLEPLRHGGAADSVLECSIPPEVLDLRGAFASEAPGRPPSTQPQLSDALGIGNHATLIIRPIQKKTGSRRGPVCHEVGSGAYFACALRAAMSASLRSVITPILLSRQIGTMTLVTPSRSSSETWRISGY
jgi:hypothetical protein